MSDAIALSGVGFRYAYWRLAEEMVSRDPEAPEEIKAVVAEAIPFYRPHVPADEMEEIESMAWKWKAWSAQAILDLSGEWSKKIDEMDSKGRTDAQG